MLRNILFGLAGLSAAVCLSTPANALIVKHTINADYAYAYIVCPVTEQPDCIDSPEPIFGVLDESFNSMEIEMVFRTGTTAVLRSFGGPTRAKITINGVTRVFNAFASDGFDVDNCTYPVYINECKGSFSFYISIIDSIYSGTVFGYIPIYWSFDDPDLTFFNVNGYSGAGNIDGDGSWGLSIADKSGHSVSLGYEYFEFGSEPLSSIPLPSALPLLVSGIGLLGWASARRRRT